jgi:hypothetical protein
MIQGRHPFARQWRAQTLYTATFLVDGDRAIAPYGITIVIA